LAWIVVIAATVMAFGRADASSALQILLGLSALIGARPGECLLEESQRRSG
jgi:hypothetical protein